MQARVSPSGEGNSDHPLAKFAGILSDAEAEELQESLRKECRQVDLNEWEGGSRYLNLSG